MVFFTFNEKVPYSLLNPKFSGIYFCSAFKVRDLFILPHETIVFSGDSCTRLVSCNASSETHKLLDTATCGWKSQLLLFGLYEKSNNRICIKVISNLTTAYTYVGSWWLSFFFHVDSASAGFNKENGPNRSTLSQTHLFSMTKNGLMWSSSVKF